MARSTASAAISVIGLCTVVSGGAVYVASGMSSKPTTDTRAGNGDAAAVGRVERAEGEQIGRRDDGRRRSWRRRQLTEGIGAGSRVADRGHDVGIVRWHPQLAEALDERRPPFAEVAVRPAADEAEAAMAERDEMVDGETDARPIVDVDGVDPE